MDKQQKIKLVEACQQQLLEKISRTKQAMEAAQEAANAEGKSSVGDKYETTRAQMQAERDRYARQLAEIQKQYQLFNSLPFQTESNKVMAGSLVLTSQGNYLLAASLGELQQDKTSVMVISALSPIGQELLDRQEGESISFRGRAIKIHQIL